MKITLFKQSIEVQELSIHILIWLFYFSTVNAFWTESWVDKSVRPLWPAPLSVLLVPVFFYANAFWLMPRFFKKKKWYVYMIIAGIIVLILESLRALVFIWLMPSQDPFIDVFLAEIVSRDSFIFAPLNPVWFGLFPSFVYRFLKDWSNQIELIEKLKTEKMMMELNFLKSQINPHFLFNNLNALDGLIDKDKDLAKRYVHQLATIYRYLIKSVNEDLVFLQEEWQFIEAYIYLLEERFGAVYQFNRIVEIENLEHYLIPPAALQNLVENVVKHNQGSLENPLEVSIKISSEGIEVQHLKRPKIGGTETTILGTGLNNLKSRYQLLTDATIFIEDTTHFTVRLPLIKALP